jgi:hypothetical protein
MKARSLLAGALIAAGALLVIALGAAIVVLIAAGLGALLSGLLPISAFEATLLSLIALVGVTLIAEQLIGAIARFPTGSPASADEDDWEEDEEDWESDWEEIMDWAEATGEGQEDLAAPGLSKQMPIQRGEFEKVGRNDPCPCGSGKKYKNCHGRAAQVN